jgi:hypothetical protein
LNLDYSSSAPAPYVMFRRAAGVCWESAVQYVGLIAFLIAVPLSVVGAVAFSRYQRASAAKRTASSGPSVAPPGLRARRRRALWVTAGFLSLIPVLFIGLSIGLTVNGLSLRTHVEPVAGWSRTDGTVIGVVTVPVIKGAVYAPIIRFSAVGHAVIFRGPTSSDIPTIGSRAAVSYDPHDPSDAHDLSLGSVWEWQFYAGIASLPLEALWVAKAITTIMRVRRRLRRRGERLPSPRAPIENG